MSSAPQTVTRDEQPYVAIRARVPYSELGDVADRIPEILGWLGRRGLTPAGAPFFKYNVIDMMGELEVEVGVPLASAVEGDGSIEPGVLPPGRYATLTCVGSPSELPAATKTLLDWAAAQGLAFDVSRGEDGERWASRLEVYLTDPAQEPDTSKWETQLAFRLAD